MKKILSVISLIAFLSVTTPVLAHGGEHPSGHGEHHPQPHKIHAGAHHRPSHKITPRHHKNIVFYTSPHLNYRHHRNWHSLNNCLCGYNSFYYPYAPHLGAHFPIGRAGISIRF